MNLIYCECPVETYEVDVDILHPDVTPEMLKESYDYYYDSDDCRVGHFLLNDNDWDDSLMDEWDIHPSESEWFHEELGNSPEGQIIYIWGQRGGLVHREDGFPYFIGTPKGGEFMMKKDGKWIYI